MDSLATEAVARVVGFSEPESEEQNMQMSWLHGISLSEQQRAVFVVLELHAQRECVDRILNSTLRTLSNELKLG